MTVASRTVCGHACAHLHSLSLAVGPKETEGWRHTRVAGPAVAPSRWAQVRRPTGGRPDSRTWRPGPERHRDSHRERRGQRARATDSVGSRPECGVATSAWGPDELSRVGPRQWRKYGAVSSANCALAAGQLGVRVNLNLIRARLLAANEPGKQPARQTDRLTVEAGKRNRNKRARTRARVRAICRSPLVSGTVASWAADRAAVRRSRAPTFPSVGRRGRPEGDTLRARLLVGRARPVQSSVSLQARTSGRKRAARSAGPLVRLTYK